MGVTKATGKYTKTAKEINPITRDQINNFLVEYGKPELLETDKNKQSIMIKVMNHANVDKKITSRTKSEFWKRIKEASS